jgi:hypothetical protein
MEADQGVQKSTARWKLLFVGFLFGVLASFLVLVVIACIWGPRGRSIHVDLYSGRTLVYKNFLGKRSSVPGPIEPHVQWAIDHQDPVRSWYLPAGGQGRGWFKKGPSVRFSTRSYVDAIYSLQIPEEEKVEVLRQYHNDLDAMKLKERQQNEYYNFMDPFRTKWEQKMKTLKGDPAIQ